MNYRHLFEKGRIGSLTLKNRIVMPPMGTNLAGPRFIMAEDKQVRY
ncbi:hypothetical protein [Bacillus sp. 1NLA3E]|nr:hypothetical protein [Bacillus sp. 1NLA3E]